MANNCAGWRQKATLTSDYCPHSLLAALLSGSSSVVLVDSVRLDPSMTESLLGLIGLCQILLTPCWIPGVEKGEFEDTWKFGGQFWHVLCGVFEGNEIDACLREGSYLFQISGSSFWRLYLSGYHSLLLFLRTIWWNPRFFIPLSLIQGLWSFHSKFLVFLFASFTHSILPVHVL